MQAEAGYFALISEPGGLPARMGFCIVDYMAGPFAWLGLLSGVIAARVSEQGRDIDVILFDTALPNPSYLATWYLNDGHEEARAPRSAHPSLGPTQLYRTKDG
jgi:succinate--hydroxymethylglutarate CoA-transferase